MIKSFKAFLSEERTGAQAAAVYNRAQKIHGYGNLNPLRYLGGIGHDKPIGQKLKGVMSMLRSRGKHFPEDPKKRPEPVKRKIRIRDLIATQPNINRKAVEEYIDKFSKKPDATKNPGISTFENDKSPENPFVGDGHHRLAALAALGHTEVTVDHHIKT